MDLADDVTRPLLQKPSSEQLSLPQAPSPTHKPSPTCRDGLLRRNSTIPPGANRLQHSMSIQSVNVTQRNTAYAISASFIIDALHGRENTLYNTTKTAINCKFLYHSRLYRDFVTTVCLCHVLLGLIEHRGYDWYETDWFVEGTFCLIYMVDSMIVLTFIGKARWIKHDSWIFVLAVAMAVDIAFCACSDLIHYPFLRCLRPAFFAARRRHIKSCFSSMMKAGWECMPLLGILTFLVITFAVIGWITFDSNNEPYRELNHDEDLCYTANHGDGNTILVNQTFVTGTCDDYFRTMSSSLYQVWILLMKVNMPDVMTP